MARQFVVRRGKRIPHLVGRSTHGLRHRSSVMRNRHWLTPSWANLKHALDVIAAGFLTVLVA
jgi:hypothetical protein